MVAQRITSILGLLTIYCICQSQCKRAFSSLDDVRGNGSLLVKAIPDNSSKGHMVFPHMKFTCEGEVRKLKFLASPDNLRRSTSSAQLLFGTGRFDNEMNLKVVYGNGTLKRIGSSGKGFEIEYNPGMRYYDGDSLAVDTSNFELLYYDIKKDIERCVCQAYVLSTIRGCRNISNFLQPLIAVETEQGCVKGFINEEVFDYIMNGTNGTNNHTIHHSVDGFLTFQDLEIAKSGLLVKFTFVAEPPINLINPRLIILPSNYSRAGYNCSDSRVKCLDNYTANATEYPFVYESILDPPLPVSTGDYIAIDQPPENDSILKIKFVRIPTTVPTEIRSNELPLIHLEILPSNEIESFSVTPSATQFTTKSRLLPVSTTQELSTNTVEESVILTITKSDPIPNTGAIAGGVVVGILAIILIASSITVIAVIKRKRRSNKGPREGTSNPTYIPNLSSGSGKQKINSQIYAEPTKPATNGNTHHTTTTTSPTEEVQYTEPSAAVTVAEYAQLTQTTTATNTITNAEYFLSHKHPSINTQNQNHYEFQSGIYVPTKEQRQHIQCDSNVYATLESGSVYATLEEVQLKGKEKNRIFFEECESYWNPAHSTDDLYAQLANRKYREIPAHLIREIGHLGSGEFGTVNKGLWQDKEQCIEVAVKRLKDDFSEEEAVMFLQEAAIMGQFKHSNIIQLYGVVTIVKPVMIVTELAHHGNLREYLLSRFNIDPGELPPSDTAALLSQFSVQVARGMKYLSSKAFVHRDLAARNILVTDTKTCKISDFGMSRDLADSYYLSKGGRIPVKWTAPEALHYKKYLTASDVWSFGCLMYEIWSLGHKPFEGYTNIEAIRHVDKGQRLAPPPGCPKEIYRLMINCWNVDKSARPQFREIVETLSQPEDLLLHIPEDVTKDHPQASILGAPLEAGRHLYTELQNTYMVV